MPELSNSAKEAQDRARHADGKFGRQDREEAVGGTEALTTPVAAVTHEGAATTCSTPQDCAKHVAHGEDEVDAFFAEKYRDAALTSDEVAEGKAVRASRAVKAKAVASAQPDAEWYAVSCHGRHERFERRVDGRTEMDYTTKPTPSCHSVARVNGETSLRPRRSDGCH